jgi:RNA polymerase sigma-70 factor (ECF subfamily)
LRKRRRSAATVSVEALLESGHEPSAPEQPEAHPDLERLHIALAQLSPKERLVLTLLELEERSIQEIADLTGWSCNNVKVRAFRARAALRKLMENSP